MEEQNSHLRKDSLTGLDRIVLDHAATPDFLRQSVNGTSVSLIYADVDNLKTFQDYNGLPLGDTLLQTVADAMRTALPVDAKLYRQGGDEFMVFLPNCSLEQTVQIAETIRQNVAQIKLDGYGKWTAISPGITLGIAFSDRSAWNPLQLIQQAKAANAKGKAAGKNTVCC